MVICTVVWKALYNFKIKRAQEARHNQFFFQNFQSNEIFEIFNMFRNNSWINVYYTKSKRLQSWLFCFQLEIPFFGVNLVQKLKIISLSWNFVLRLIQIRRIPSSCSLFLFSSGNTFLGKFDPKNQSCQFELKLRTSLIWICRFM